MAETCAARSRDLAEPLHGTASRARRWILLEQPGAWGRDALLSSALPAEVGTYLHRLADEVPARVLLLRRPGRQPARPQRTLLVGHSGPGGGWLEQLELEDAREIMDVGFEPLRDNASVGGEPLAEPRYLVCTNGKHDPCCAELGIPVAKALVRVVGDRVWECSHVGGDRFAGNLVCLPDGLLYGRLDADTAKVAVAANEAGRLDLDRWRGRSSLPFAFQAAEALLRREAGIDAIHAVRFRGGRRGADGLHRVTFTLHDDRTVEVTVQEGRQEVARALTCAGAPGRAPTFELVSIDDATGSPSA